MLYHIPEFHSFLRLNNIALCVYTSSFIYSSVDTWVASTFWRLWIVLLWTWVYKYLFESLLSLLLGLTRKWNRWILWSFCLIFEAAPYCFPQLAAPFYIPTHSAQGFYFLHLLINICYFLGFFDNSHPHGCDVAISFDSLFSLHSVILPTLAMVLALLWDVGNSPKMRSSCFNPCSWLLLNSEAIAFNSFSKCDGTQVHEVSRSYYCLWSMFKVVPSSHVFWMEIGVCELGDSRG